jgi:hypothetical protein
MRDNRIDTDFNLPGLDTEHDPSGGALRGILLAWLIVIIMIATLALWWVT